LQAGLKPAIWPRQSVSRDSGILRGRDWQLNPKLRRVLLYADQFVLGLVDFHKMLDLFRQAGMNYPMNWKDEELKKTEDMLNKEIEKASSMFVSSQAPDH
jgi:hypothetical protein